MILIPFSIIRVLKIITQNSLGLISFYLGTEKFILGDILDERMKQSLLQFPLVQDVKTTNCMYLLLIIASAPASSDFGKEENWWTGLPSGHLSGRVVGKEGQGRTQVWRGTNRSSVSPEETSVGEDRGNQWSLVTSLVMHGALYSIWQWPQLRTICTGTLGEWEGGWFRIMLASGWP